MLSSLKFFTGFPVNFFLLSVICGEAHGWGWYNYTEATVYTNYLNESVENPGGKWTDFCDTVDNTCFGIFCDGNQYLSVAGECVNSENKQYSESRNIGFVYFHDDSPNYTITTKSQEYFKDLKSRVTGNDLSVYIRTFDNSMNVGKYESLFSRYQIAPYTFESDTMLFLVNFNNSFQLLLIDYHCSLVYTRLQLLDYKGDNKQWRTITWTITILSAISVSIVAIFYACIRELRNNIIGKLVLLLAITEAIIMSKEKFALFIAATFLDPFFENLNTLWFLAMVYETFVLLKYCRF
jgi:hypothetical protein